MKPAASASAKPCNASTAPNKRERERERALVEADVDGRIAAAVETLREEIDARDSAFVSLAGFQSQWTAAFIQRVRELGWIEGRTIAVEGQIRPG